MDKPKTSTLEEEYRKLQKRLEEIALQLKTTPENSSQLPPSCLEEITYPEKVGKNNFATYKKTPGATDFGRPFEELMTTFYALTLSIDENIKNFKMTVNNGTYGLFDDVCLEVICQNNKCYKFLIQLKHRETKTSKSRNALASSTKHFNLSAYLKNAGNFQENGTTCVLLTNVQFDIDKCDTLELEGKKVEIKICSLDIDFLLTNKSALGFSFDIAPNFVLVPGQANVKIMKKRIVQLVETLELRTEIRDLFRSFIVEWSKTSYVLTKSDVLSKLIEFSLSPYAEILTTGASWPSEILENTIQNFQLTIVEEFEDDIVRDIWKCGMQPPDQKIMNQTQTKYYLQEDQDSVLLWYLDLAPLVIKVNKDIKQQVKSALRLLEHGKIDKPILLYGGLKMTTFLRPVKDTFTSLADLRDNQIIDTISVSFRPNQTVSLRELIEKQFRTAVTTSVLFGALQTNNHVTLQNTNVRNYIPRIVSTPHGPINDQDFFHNSTKALNTICAPAGAGKTTLLKFLSNRCPVGYWSLFITLQNHKLLLESAPTTHQIWNQFLHFEKLSPFLQEAKNILWKSKKMYVLLDGLDSLGKKGVDVVMGFVNQILEDGYKVMIATRENLKHVFVEETFTIRGMCPEDQKKLFGNYLQSYEKHQVGHVMNVLYDSMNQTNSQTLLEIPQNVYRVARCLTERENFQKLQEKRIYPLTKLIEQLIEEALPAEVKPAIEYLLRKVKSCYLEPYEIFAKGLYTFLPEKINMEEHDFLKQDPLGLIKCDGPSLAFTHEHFAEYFSSIWLKKNRDKMRKIQETFVSARLYGVRQMFDINLAENCDLHLAIIYRNMDQFDNYLKEFPKEDEEGRTAVHLLSIYASRYQRRQFQHMLNALFKKDKSCMLKRDKLFDFSPNDYFVRCNDQMYLELWSSYQVPKKDCLIM